MTAPRSPDSPTMKKKRPGTCLLLDQGKSETRLICAQSGLACRTFPGQSVRPPTKTKLTFVRSPVFLFDDDGRTMTWVATTCRCASPGADWLRSLCPVVLLSCTTCMRDAPREPAMRFLPFPMSHDTRVSSCFTHFPQPSPPGCSLLIIRTWHMPPCLRTYKL